MEQSAEAYQNGKLLLIDKPLEWTSFQVVNKLRWLIRKQFNIKKIKVGHAGTLDPLATGLLLICTGKFTKRIPELQGWTKEYTGTITFGSTTPSYDLETEVDQTFDITALTKNQIQAAIPNFLGEIWQAPPVFSALKKDGKRLYEYARAGEEVQIQKRQVTVVEFELTNFQLPQVDFRIRCSKGTYIRSLAHDLGKDLGNGAHLSALRRTKIGDHNVIDAVTPIEFEELISQNQ